MRASIRPHSVLATVLVSGSLALAIPTAAQAVSLPPSGAEPFSIGNRIFIDNGSDGAGGFNAGQRNNGIQDANERGVNGVLVQLYYDANTNGVPDPDELVRADITAAGQAGPGRPGSSLDGYYLFDDLPQGSYIVVVPASEFAVGKPLGGHHSSTFNGTASLGAPGATGQPATDTDDNGIGPASRRPDINGVRSNLVTFVDAQTVVTGETDLSLQNDPGAPINDVGTHNPTGWDGPGSIGRRTTGAQRDDASNVAVDFGFIPPMSIGNRIWLDDSSDPAQWGPGGSRNNGRIDATDDGNLAAAGLQNPGIANVPVQLYADVNNNSSVDAGDVLVASTTTNATGYYLFDGLAPGAYLVRVPAGAFSAGQPLNGLISSFDASAQPNPANHVDNDDNGLDDANPATNGVTTRQIQLTYLGEATGETDPSPQTQAARGRFAETDADSDLTIDLGFTRPPMSIGNQVWFDDHPTGQVLRNNGILNGGEAPLSGVQVALYRDINSNGNVDAGEDTGLRSTTNATGSYRFDNLPPGNYIVAIATANFNAGGPLENMVSSRSTAPNPIAADTQIDDNDNGLDPFVVGIGVISSRITLAYGTESTVESGIGPYGSHGERNSDSDFSVDFGFYVPMSLGNRVWLDDSASPSAVGTTRDNGVLDTAADDLDNPNIAGVQGLGVAGVTMRLFRDLNANGTIDAGEDTGRTTTTNATGYYLFDGLPRGRYLVSAEASNFAAGNPLFGFRSSTDGAAPTDNNLDSRDKGVGTTPSPVSGIISPSITLSWTSPTVGDETTSESDPTPQTQANRGANGERDDFSNLTVDYGFVRTNTAPTAVANSYETAYDTTLTVAAPGVLGNDTDPEGDTLSAVLVTGASHGSLTLNVDGSFTYSPTSGYSGSDSFTYRVNDGTQSSGTATVGITVLPDMVPPTVTLDAPAGPVTGPFEVSVEFSEPVTGLAAGGFTVDGGTAELSGSGASYDLTVTPTASGDLTVALPADRAADTAGNGNTASATLTRVADIDLPSVVLSAPDGPVRDAFEVTATFSEEVTGFGLADVTVDNGTASDLVADGDTYTFTVTPHDQGEVRVDVAADAATDAAGNGSTAADTLTRVHDSVSPTAELDAADGPFNGAFDVSVELSESVSGLTASDFSVDGDATVELTGSGSSYVLAVTPADSGTITVALPADRAVDAAGNGNTASASLTRAADLDVPTVLLSAPAGPQGGAFEVTATFSEDVTGFGLDDVTVDNGAASDLVADGDSYTFTVTPDDQGDVTLDIGAGAATDAAGNGSTAADTLTRVFDSVRPVVTLDAAAGPVNGTFTVSITLSEPAGDLAVADLAVTNGTLSDLSGTGTSYAVDVTPTSDGPVSLGVAAGAVADAAGNTSAAASLTRTADLVAPTATLSATVDEPTNAASITVDVAFSEPVTGLAVGDLTVAGGTLSALTGSGSSYAVTLTFAAGSGSASVGLPAGAAADAAGNLSKAAADLTVDHDGSAPTLTIGRGAGQADPVRTDRVVFVVTADEPVSDLATGGLVLGGSADATAATVRRTGPATFEVTATGMSASGEVELSVAAGAVRDAAGSPSLAVGPAKIAWATTARPVLRAVFDNRCLTGGTAGTVSLSLASDGPTTVTATSSDAAVVPSPQVDVSESGDGGQRVLVTVRSLRSGSATVTVAATNARGTVRRQFRVHVGTDGRDRIVGAAGPDIVFARGGDDIVSGWGGRDLLCGGAGDDRMYGGAGRDTLYGQGGKDLLVGGTRGDRLIGGPGRDVVPGDPGVNDTSLRAVVAG